MEGMKHRRKTFRQQISCLWSESAECPSPIFHPKNSSQRQIYFVRSPFPVFSQLPQGSLRIQPQVTDMCKLELRVNSKDLTAFKFTGKAEISTVVSLFGLNCRHVNVGLCGPSMDWVKYSWINSSFMSVVKVDWMFHMKRENHWQIVANNFSPSPFLLSLVISQKSKTKISQI